MMAAHTSEDGSSSEERGWQLASAWMVAARLGVDDGSSWMMAARLGVDDGSSPQPG